MRAIHVCKSQGMLAHENVYPHYENWINLELIYFFSWVISLMLFLFCAYWIKFKSIRKQKYDLMNSDGIETEINLKDFNGIWNSKDSDDFLRYLKWEAFTFGYVFSMVIMNIIILWWETFERNRITTVLLIVIGLLLFKRTYAIVLFIQQLSTNKGINWFRCDNKKVIALNILRYLVDLSIIILYLTQYNYAKAETKFVAMWIDIEIVCILFELLYFGIVMRYLTTLKPCQERADTSGSSFYHEASKFMLQDESKINKSDSHSVSEIE